MFGSFAAVKTEACASSEKNRTADFGSEIFIRMGPRMVVMGANVAFRDKPIRCRAIREETESHAAANDLLSDERIRSRLPYVRFLLKIVNFDETNA